MPPAPLILFSRKWKPVRHIKIKIKTSIEWIGFTQIAATCDTKKVRFFSTLEYFQTFTFLWSPRGTIYSTFVTFCVSHRLTIADFAPKGSVTDWLTNWHTNMGDYIADFAPKNWTIVTKYLRNTKLVTKSKLIVIFKDRSTIFALIYNVNDLTNFVNDCISLFRKWYSPPIGVEWLCGMWWVYSRQSAGINRDEKWEGPNSVKLCCTRWSLRNGEISFCTWCITEHCG